MHFELFVSVVWKYLTGRADLCSYPRFPFLTVSHNISGYDSLSFRLLVEQRASTMLRQRTLFDAGFSAVFQLMFAFFNSSSVDLLQVLAGLPSFNEISSGRSRP